MAFFHLKPIKAARVSEISEATAAAPVSPAERVNFHIGNPLQDPRQTSAFLRLTLGLDIHQEDLQENQPERIMKMLGWPEADRPKLDFIIRTINRSSPYMPRGGYSRQNPNTLIKLFTTWLNQQQEPLHYDMGEKSARREMIIASGGTLEVLRVILFVISTNLETTPVRILSYRCVVPPSVKTIPNLYFEDLASDERVAYAEIEQFFAQQPDVPTFLLLGSPIEEDTRRKLYILSLKYPLFFIEANDVPNHLSLAREAKLVQRVIRLLTPGIFAPRLRELSTVFVAGNADFLKAIESVHFELKGTPSASEVEFLTYILEHKLDAVQVKKSAEVPEGRPAFYGLGMDINAERTPAQIAGRIELNLERLSNDFTQRLSRITNVIEKRTAALDAQIEQTWKSGIADDFAAVEANDLLDLMVENVDNPVWNQTLQRSFLSNFIKHQPQYRPEACVVVSGSSRTALGLLGFHCGISEVVIPDLSWSYDQCFQKTHTVPLTATLKLDVAGFIEKLETLCSHDPSWHERGAVVISNPHNATGQIFAEDAIRKLVIYCMQHSLHIIDDLAYQNMAPVDDLPEIKTARQIAEELVQHGILDESETERLITVHSVSKTDSLAGARLAVIEVRDPQIRQRFQALNARIQPNIAAAFIGYLFYRGPRQSARSYWHLRNLLFKERSQALVAAAAELPADRNPFDLTITPPKGSMYPLLQMERLPAGLSLDWLASSLARQGIGMLPLSTFARTEKGYETGRKTFRLTLGGVDNAETLKVKTRRLLIDLNRLITEEQARYNRKRLKFRLPTNGNTRHTTLARDWDAISKQIIQAGQRSQSLYQQVAIPQMDSNRLQREFLGQHIPERLSIFRTRLLDRALVSDALMRRALATRGDWLQDRLEKEFIKDSLERRQAQFKARLYDRTVHPTQAYSIQAEIALDEIIRALIHNQPVTAPQIENAAHELIKEYLGLNVNISSRGEVDEFMLDLAALGTVEDYAALFSGTALPSLLSFWSDWDGSNRPSGQGHQLIGGIVIENVRRMARLISLLRQTDPSVPVNSGLLSQINRLPEQNQRFSELLSNITILTHQLEQRYRGILPYSLNTTSFQQLASRLGLRRDPARVLWQHNDRYERKMIELRQQRRDMLERYFALNKQLRKQLYALIPQIQENRTTEVLLREVVGFHDLLQRTLITPRIHQGLITARDQFAIDTTVFNLDEINTISGKYGNPGMILGLQVSMSTRPEALISLDRKFRTQEQQMYREQPQADLPSVWLIPLFEKTDAVDNIRAYLDRVWDYSTQSRHTAQSPEQRFAEIISEVFIAGSDLSQQASQATSAFLYRKVKFDVQSWLAEHGVAEAVRIKLGSGEPMQRQGGYYSQVAGQPAFLDTEGSRRRFNRDLPAPARKSTAYAVTPLQGVFSGGDLRTFQSNISEEIRFIPVPDYADLLHHLQQSQRNHRDDLIRAAETITESRLGPQSRSLQELERLTIHTNDDVYINFLDELTDNFRQILYGQEEDVIGIHIISYFIGRSIPQLRDRPASRRTSGSGREQGQQILANIAEIIPLSNQGSLLRAISHNQSQTVVLGINQLTTGLFRALERFAQTHFAEAERERMIAERLLPNLPVYEILHTLRIYQDWEGTYLHKIETALPAGNSAFVALREDNNAMHRYLPLFQQELLRRHGLNVHDFFTHHTFIPDLLPTLRPELAVLLQKDLFNTNLDAFLTSIEGKISDEWRTEVTQLLQLPEQINFWRAAIWDVLGESIYQRVQSFSELATALYSLSSTNAAFGQSAIARGTKLPPNLTNFFRTTHADDEMRRFLLGTLEYLNTFVEGNIEVPISIIRAINDVERIVQIEESALSPEKQDAIRFCILQVARLAGENG